jgi:inhibitor of cysteine peptidase
MEMKLKLMLPVLIAILALSLPVCSPAVKEVPLQATYDDFTQNKNLTREIAVGVGNVVRVTVASNPTTGFRWELAGISTPTVVEQNGEAEYVLPDSAASGAGGQEIWTFKALKRGTSRISLAYSRPWEGGTKAEWTLGISLSVK